MPREQINYPNRLAVLVHGGNVEEYVEGTTLPEGGQVYADPALHINWNPEGGEWGAGHVQLSIELEAGYFKALASDLDVDVVSSKWVYTPSLSRGELNRLIRTLRRARDAAYGSDE